MNCREQTFYIKQTDKYTCFSKSLDYYDKITLYKLSI